MLFYTIGLMLYLSIGGVTSGISTYCFRKDPDMYWAPVPVLLGWPFVWLAAFCYFVVVATHRFLMQIGRSIGLRKNRMNIVRQTVTMMEADEGRLGEHGKDLILSWEYKPCPVCFGSGCKKCAHGIVRMRANGDIVDANGRMAYQ